MKYARHRKRSLNRELLKNYTLYSVILFVLITLILFWGNFNIMADEIFSRNEVLAGSMVYQLEEMVRSEVRVVKTVEEMVEHDFVTLDEDINKYLERLVANNSILLDIVILDKNGIIVNAAINSDSVMGLDYSKQPFVTELIETGELYYSAAFFSMAFDRPVTSVSFKSDDCYYVSTIALDSFEDAIATEMLGDKNLYAITDQTGTFIAHSQKRMVETRSKSTFYNKKKFYNSNYDSVVIDGRRYIYTESISDELGWSVILMTEINTIFQPIAFMVMIVSLFAIACIVFFSMIVFNRVKRITWSLNTLINRFRELSKGNHNVVVEEVAFIEFQQLYKQFNLMSETVTTREEEIKELNKNLEELVASRTQELENKNRMLENSMEELVQTQERLIQSEKHAALSQMIAGVAHEINTPIGISVTLSSFVQKTVLDMEDLLLNEKLSKKKFVESIGELKQSSKNILSSLEQASNLIQSIKQASSDAFLDVQKYFDLKELLENLVYSIKTQFSHKNISIDIETSTEDFFIYSNPSAILQLFTNLIMNAYHHGFLETSEGQIHIKLSNEEGNISICFSDNGVGIPYENQKKIFEPFFTTKRGEGGTGLGLNIVQNIVIKHLQGEIDVKSSAEGTEFYIQFPEKTRDFDPSNYLL